ncbi:DnaJ domain-containing protein [Pilobolus umbonatus]|nr:DnaJ domain-containing protein [Pilobolus umbonatus]
MEFNKDEAIRCLNLAKNQYGAKNYDTAVRLTKKSISLFPTDEAREFLKKAEGQAQSSPTPPPTEKKAAKGETKKASEEQSREVREILACGNDYYKVLKVNKQCTEIEIKKAYRKLALKFHPDKNKTPGADEAFKLISKAFTVLSDPQKKAIHDAGGGRDPEHRSSQFRTQQYGASPFDDEISPEDLFNMFFGGNGARFSSATFVGPGFRTRTFNTGGFQQPSFQPQQRTGWSIFLQMLPLILLFGYTLLSGLFSDEYGTPQFSFQSTSVYSLPRMTESHHVPYYVNPSTFQSMKSDHVSRLEKQIEVDWVRSLQQQCQVERRQQQLRISNSKGGPFGLGRDEKRYKEALNMKLTSCDELKRFGYIN